MLDSIAEGDRAGRPEFIARAVADACRSGRANTAIIEPTSPRRTESFTAPHWNEVLRGQRFETLVEVKVLTAKGRKDNLACRRSAHGNQTFCLPHL